MARDIGPARVAAFLAAASLSLAVSWPAAAQSDPAVAAQGALAKCQSAYQACGRSCVGASCETCEELRKKCRAEVYSIVTPGAKKPSGGKPPGGGTGTTTPGGSATASEPCPPGTESAPTDVRAEEKFCLGHIVRFWNCLGARPIANEAQVWAESQIAAQGWPPDSLHNGIADAARHAYWMCRTAQEYGVAFAKGLGDAHEEDSGQGGYGATNSCEEKTMDLHNNSVGRDLSLAPTANCAEKVLSSLDLLRTCCGH